MKEPEPINYPIIVELVGRSGVGKSFIFNKLKKELNDNHKYLFIDVERCRNFGLFNIKIFFNSLFKIICCSLKSEVFIKYLKRWYLSQVLIANCSNYKEVSFVIIDEGPFQIVRSIRRFRKKSVDKVRSCLFDRSIFLPDTVVVINANWGTIYSRRQIRKDNQGKKSYKYASKSNKKDDGLRVTKEDIEYATSIKEISLIDVDNTNNNLDSNIKYIINELNRIQFNIEGKNTRN